jgi:hypothetical protein
MPINVLFAQCMSSLSLKVKKICKKCTCAILIVVGPHRMRKKIEKGRDVQNFNLSKNSQGTCYFMAQKNDFLFNKIRHGNCLKRLKFQTNLFQKTKES